MASIETKLKNNYISSLQLNKRRDTQQLGPPRQHTLIQPKKQSRIFHNQNLNVDQEIYGDQPNTNPKSIKSKFIKLMNHNGILLFMSIVAALSLILNDVKYVFFSNLQKDVFNALFIFISIVFGCDFIISWWVIEDYVCGFYFWLDFIAASSMLFEIEEIIGKVVNPYDDDAYVEKQNDTARFLIFINILRIVRLVRIVKIYRNYRQWQYKEDILKKINQALAKSKKLN